LGFGISDCCFSTQNPKSEIRNPKSNKSGNLFRSFLAETVSRQDVWLKTGVFCFFSFKWKAPSVLPFVFARGKTGGVFHLSKLNCKKNDFLERVVGGGFPAIRFSFRVQTSVCPPAALRRRAPHAEAWILNFVSQNFAVLCLLFCLLLLTNCKSETVIQPTAPTREITDDLGRRVRLPERVTSAVSLAPNLTEITFAVGAGERLVGATSFCDYPEEAKKIRRIGDTLAPNIENIVALKPQVVLVSTASQVENFTKTLDAQDIAYFVTNPNSLDDIYKSIYQIGEIFSREEKAYQTVDELKRRVAEVEARTSDVKDVKVFVQIDKNSLYTVGRDSFITDLIRRAGGESLTEDVATAYPKISKETALALNPERIILSESDNNLEPNEVFANSPAVKNGKVFSVEADLLSRPGPRVVDGLERIARALHPESFK